MKIDYSDAISRHRKIAAHCCLRALWLSLSVASFVLPFSPLSLRLERNLRAGSVLYFMYFHLVYSPDISGVVSPRKSTRKLFCRATELMVTIDHEFVGNSASPPFAFLSYPFHMGMWLPSGKRLIMVFCETYGCVKPRFLSCANANFLYL